LSFSLGIGALGSHVPHESLDQARAAFLPATIWAVKQVAPQTSSQANNWSLVSMTSLRFRQFINGSLTFAFLILT
jgi:hypothetical protein